MVQLPAPFEGPVLKWARARHHIDALSAEIEAYHASKPYGVRWENDEFIVERTGPFPSSISLMVGDAIHNLRTALDLLANDLVRLKGGSTKGVYYPFGQDEAGLIEQIKQKNFDRAGPDAVSLLKRIAPHKNGRRLLYGIHALDVMDKHQLLLPMFHAGVARDVRVTGPGGDLVFEEISGPGDGFGIGPITQEHQFEVGSFHLVAVFEETAPDPFPYHPIVHTLQCMADLVGGIIEAFRTLSFGNVPDVPPRHPVFDDKGIEGGELVFAP